MRERGKWLGPEHDRERRRRQDAQRPSASQRGDDAAWRKVRNEYLAEHPWCEECGAKATMVDHRKPVRDGGTRDKANLRALCRPCHNRRHIRDGHYFAQGRSTRCGARGV